MKYGEIAFFFGGGGGGPYPKLLAGLNIGLAHDRCSCDALLTGQL